MKTGIVQLSETGQLWIVDPNNKFHGVAESKGATEETYIAYMLGDVPRYIEAAKRIGIANLKQLEEVIESMYFPLTRNFDGSVDEKLIYRYPEDPDLHPLLVYKQDAPFPLTFVIYPDSMVYIKVGNESLISRID